MNQALPIKLAISGTDFCRGAQAFNGMFGGNNGPNLALDKKLPTATHKHFNVKKKRGLNHVKLRKSHERLGLNFYEI